MNKIIDFQHKISAHCENGVTSNLLRFSGLELSEPMVFGIGSGLFFSYLPFIKLNNAPGFSFRTLPGWIFKRVSKRLGIKIKTKTFKNENNAMEELDILISQGKPVGLQVGVFNLTYFPDPYRFHFNAHNIVVYGKKDGKYLISDPVLENTATLTESELQRVRFAKGPLSPKGRMYYIESLNSNFDLKNAIRQGIKRTCSDMLNVPVPLFGLKGIKKLSVLLKSWQKDLGDRKASQYLAQVIRMQEEIGTGGAGFRFIFAAFLQEASKVMEIPALSALSKDMTSIGDSWREFALMASRICKNRAGTQESYNNLSEIIASIHLREKELYQKLLKAIA